MTARNVSVDGSEVTGRGWGQVNYAQEWITYSPADVASIYNRIPGAQLPCNTTSVVRFKISSPARLEVPLPPADLISSTIPDQPGMCVGSIVANTHSDEWAFGSAFLKNVYVVYQRSKDGIYGDNPSKFGIAALSAEENLYTDGSPVPSDLSAKAWSGGMRQNRLSTGTIAIVAVTVAAAVLM
ncbi:uncharacterized protein EHS24_005826 [Apiotrichum porosum]|uniref:Peptidase A1 domain-containing protein n=1 Tax=Apiotrichum porosum TaxID=105984 RepID=A0A427XZS7_9TREE|nr:uncharacterized protein EHS24_005826 [Apiotrichum porosum]RSH84310.1 hypothetical protein EHS24_005826 [Apiotrichum porosum]